MTDFKQTEIGTLPEDWEIKRIGDFCDIRSSSILFSEITKIKEQSGFLKVLALKVSDMNLEGNENEIKTAQIEFYLNENNSYIRYLIPPFALIFPKRGAAISTNKKRIVQCYSILDPNLMALIPNQTCNLYYLYHYFQRFDLRTITDKGLVPQLNKKDLLPLVVPLPSLSEQSNIAKILSIIQSAIEAQEKIIQTTTELKKALMQKLFMEGLCGEPQRETEIGRVPKSWQVVELGDVCIQRKEAVTPTTNGKGIYVGLEHIQTGEFRLPSYGNESEVRSAKYKFYEGDILYGKLRPYLDKAVLVDISGICSTDIIVLSGNERLLQTYSIGLVHTNKFVEYAKRTTSGVNHPRTSWNSLKKFKFGLPTIKEQKEIGLILHQLTDKIEINQSKKKGLQSLFKSMLHHLMTGQIRVKDLRFA